MLKFLFSFASVLLTSTLVISAKQMTENISSMDMMAAMSACNESFRIDMTYLQALNDSGSFPDETDRTPKCYLRCYLQMTKVATEDDVYNPAQAAIVFGGVRGGKMMDDVEVMATACSSRDEACKCERAYQFMKCLMEREIEKYDH